MAVRITARHFEIGEKTREFIESKLNKIKKYDNHENDIDVILTQEKYRYICEINLKSGPFEAAAKEEETDVIAAFEICLKQIERQIKKQKEKMISSKKQAKKKLIDIEEVGMEEEPKIIKRQGEILSLLETEAFIKFKNEKLDYLIFRNLKTDKINLLIKNPNNQVIVHIEK